VAHVASYPVGYGDSLLGVKWPEREVDHSPPSSTEVKNAWRYSFIPGYVFVVLRLINQNDNFIDIALSTVTPHRRYLYFDVVVGLA
jgi:hypothetical protein